MRWLLFVLLFGAVTGKCVREYFAQPIVYDKATTVDFYYTGINIRNVTRCAEFCGERRFCRTAVYNSYALTCAISYEYTLNCRYNTERYLEYDTSNATSHLIQVACISSCDDHSQSKIARKLANREIVETTPTSTTTQESVTSSESTKAPKEVISKHIKPGQSKICYRTLSKRYLLGAVLKKHVGVTMNECRCLCAATHAVDGAKEACASLHWYASGECILNKASHLGNFDLIEDKDATYQYVDCPFNVLREVSEKICKIKKPANKTMETTTAPQSSTEQTTTVSVKATTPEETKIEEVTTRKMETTEKPSTTAETTTKLIETTQKEIMLNDCFEMISSRMMTGVAGGLEHDVSIDECMCFCANSKKHRSFECASVSYYADERDCVLNLEDRVARPSLFEHSPVGVNVTYIGITCPRDAAQKLSLNGREQCGAPPTTTTNAPHKKKGPNSDECFMELPSFVLEGNAMAVEANTTVDACKCACADAVDRYGEECLSFLFYFDSNTCLLSKQNRFSNPESFNFESSEKKHSYFEFKCATSVLKTGNYLDKKCNSEEALKTQRPTDEEMMKATEKVVGEATTSVPDAEMSSEESEDDHGEQTETSPVAKSTTKVTMEPITEATTDATTTEAATEPATTAESKSEEEESSSTERKHNRAVFINRHIPEAEGLDDDDFGNELEKQVMDEINGASSEVNQKPMDDGTTKSPTTKSRILGVKTKKLDEKVEKRPEDRVPSTSTESTSRSTTTQSTTTSSFRTTTVAYPPAGRCTYSALYQTAFIGRRLLKSVHVRSPSDCFAACFALRCRSANLIAQGNLHMCELFRDSLIDYRRPDMIGYDGSTVYFDGIRCDGGQ